MYIDWLVNCWQNSKASQIDNDQQPDVDNTLNQVNGGMDLSKEAAGKKLL